MKTWRQKLPLWLILAIGVLTPTLSTALFFFYRPAAQINIGEVLPPAPIPDDWRYHDGRDFTAADWRGQWVLLMAADGACEGDCGQRLCRLRQLRLMLPGNYLKLRRAWLVPDAASPPSRLVMPAHCDDVEDEEIRQQATNNDVLAGVEVLSGQLPDAVRGDGLFLIDPAGLWAMRFSRDLSLYQIRKDLYRLLRLDKGRGILAAPEARQDNEGM